LLSPSVKSIACGRHGGSIEAKGDRAERALKKKATSPGHLVHIMPRLSFVGVHLFAHWLDQHETFGPVVAQLTQAVEAHKQAHPGDDFALLHHRESTLLRRFQALFFAPLCGIDRLTAFDTHDHPLATLLGRGYHSSTLSQFLGQLERAGGAEVLLPALVPAQTGPITYVDGHMGAYWSRMSMHKGKITMLGRIMAGSQAVIAHEDAGQALFVAYDPPDSHLSQVIVAYCQRVALATGHCLFVIDRAVNSVALAEAFDEQGLGLLCMLDDNEHTGLESFEATYVETLADGTRVYSGPWKEARTDAPRHLVIVQAAEGETLVYWGTPKVQDALEAQEWPGVYRERNEIQEHRFKDMIDHGALNTNYGRKKILGADRQQQRKQAQLDHSLETAHKRVDTKAAALKAQQDKVAESASKGHGKRLEQRRRTVLTLEQAFKEAKATQAKCSEQAATLGPAGQGADRDFRKQTSMTLRTLVLENWLRAFMGALAATLHTQVSLPQVLSLLFERSGSRLETPSQVLYWVNSAGLSLSNRRLLSEVAQGLGAMGLQEKGKPVHGHLKDLPP
jgi:hypothetical protein